MIKHIVFWRLFDETKGMDKKASADFFSTELKKLPEEIDVIQSFQVGLNLIESSESSDIVLEVIFNNIEDLKTYQKHPAHLAFIDKIKHLRVERRVVDYDFS